MFHVFHNVKIKAITAGSGALSVSNEEKFSKVLEPRQIARLIKSIGFKRTRYLAYPLTFFDLSLATAKYLVKQSNFDLSNLDCIISSTQSPDSLVPCNSFILQDKLNLKHSVFNLDVVQGCAGYLHAILLAASLIENRTIDSALILVGDGLSICEGNDILTPEIIKDFPQFRNAGLFGAGCGACLLTYEKDSSPLYMRYDVWGDKRDIIYNIHYARKHIEGYDPNSPVKLDGNGLADFVLNFVPKQIFELLDKSNFKLEDLQYAFVHQANASLVKSLAKVLGVSSDVMPFLAENTGNTDSASIALGIAENLDVLDKLHDDKFSLLSAFGTGLCSCSAICNLKDTEFYPAFYL